MSGSNIRKRREPRLLKCTVLNPPETPEEQEEYDNLVFETLATALSRCLDPSQIDQIIGQVEGLN